MQRINGVSLANEMLASLKGKFLGLPQKPCLAAILVGTDPSSQLYISIKEKRAGELGVRFKKVLLPVDTTQRDLEALIQELSAAKDIQGILVQLPLPSHLDVFAVTSLIDPSKDVEGFRPESGITSPLVLAIRDLLRATGVPLKGKKARLLIKSPRFYQALTSVLAEEGIAVIKNSHNADIIVTAIGRPASLKASMVKEGVVVIDVGISHVRGKLVGDSASDVALKAGYMTPVPGGVGPVTVAHLFANLLLLTKTKHTLSLFVMTSVLIPFIAFAQDSLATSETYLEAIIPIVFIIAVILFFAFLGKMN